MSSLTTRSPDPRIDEMHRALLTIAYPAFRFDHFTRDQQLRWVAVRKNSIDSGVHTVVTPDLDELQTALRPLGTSGPASHLQAPVRS